MQNDIQIFGKLAEVLVLASKNLQTIAKQQAKIHEIENEIITLKKKNSRSKLKD
jgi:hypothetical protein